MTKPVLLVLAGMLCLAGRIRAQAPQASTTELAAELAQKDSLLFQTAFTCKVEGLRSILTDDFVFYHDNGYTNPTRDQSLASFLANIRNACERNPGTKLRRELVKGSLQTFALSDQEAMQTGVQRFFVTHPGQPEKLVERSKFSRTWRKENGAWKMARELDYQVNAPLQDPRTQDGQPFQPPAYTPDDPQLHDTIAAQDSIFFMTYNTCDIARMAGMIADTVEFYHDKTGLAASKQDLLNAIRNNICGKVTRELVKGSIEVYPIPGYGAVQFGYHRFHNLVEGSVSRPGKFVTLWRHKNGRWQMSRIISLH